MRFLIFALFATLVPAAGFAQQDSLFKAGDVLVITAPNSAIYTGPDESARSKAIVQPGRRLKAAGSEINGFIPLATKSGKAYIHVVDIKVEATAPVLEDAAPLATPLAARAPEPLPNHRYSTRSGAPSEEPKSRFPFGIEHITFDLGGSFGSSNGYSYSEFSLGANAFFTDWFAWREAVFGRFSSYYGNVYGLDSSIRGIYDVRTGGFGLTLFAGPGYRLATASSSAPFAEAGLVIHLNGFSIGGGAKSILNSWVASGTPNDTQYFIILAGGGSL